MWRVPGKRSPGRPQRPYPKPSDKPGRSAAIVLGHGISDRVLADLRSYGADRILLIEDEALAGSDSYATALVLAVVLRNQPFDQILAGLRRSDLEQGQVGPMVAELLDLTQITAAREVLPGGGAGEVRVGKRIPGHVLKVSCPLPALITLEKGPSLRYPKFIDRRRAQRAPIRTLDLRAAGLSPEQVGPGSSLTQVERITPPKPTKRSALGSAVSGMTTAARLQRILSGGLQEKKESKIWECKDRPSVGKVIEHMRREKMITV